jgi:hypothetical protein
VFLKFRGAADRAEFIERVRAGRPDLVPLVRPSKTQANVVTIAAASEEQVQAIRRFAAAAREFEDVRFRTMSEGGS